MFINDTKKNKHEQLTLAIWRATNIFSAFCPLLSLTLAQGYSPFSCNCGEKDGQFYLSLTTKRINEMLIERTRDNQITITVSSSVDSFGLQRLIDYVKYLEATAKSKAKQSDVDKLADEVNASWWEKNRKRFIK
jgi:hypothetical protein